MKNILQWLKSDTWLKLTGLLIGLALACICLISTSHILKTACTNWNAPISDWYKLELNDDTLFWIINVLLLVLFFSRTQFKFWGFARLIGFLCIFSAPIIVMRESFDTYSLDEKILISAFFILISILIILLGEITLYLDNLKKKLALIPLDFFYPKYIVEEEKRMICPTCLGKGYVDLNDIKRLGMESKWSQGFCSYCNGDGDVKRGITRTKNPTGSAHHPVPHDFEPKY